MHAHQGKLMSTKHVFRGEIQGLRAVAVSLVLLFHIWPSVAPGGYIGVDVFFVISGYLIVGSLFREAEQKGKISLLNFYSKRIRRLLPTATLVLACVFGAMFIGLPPARWEDTLFQIAASALYIENWYLAWEAIDYLAVENAASPVQHYWSLSIEEQFYIAWPLVVIAATWINRRIGLPIRLLVVGALSITFVVSLTASILMTWSDPGRAYFVTHTRAWELALGGLLAVSRPTIKASDRQRALLCATGLAAIIGSSLSFGRVLFPGYSALLPTFGAALVIVAGDFRVGFFRGLNTAPMRYIGDISYSLYLWHWPLVVFYLATADNIGLVDGSLLLVATVAISHISYLFVEERFRHPNRPLEFRPIPFGVLSIITLVGAVAASYHSMASVRSTTTAPDSNTGSYPGPAALLDNAPVPIGIPVRPSPAALMKDRAIVYDSGCHQNQRESAVIACSFGDAKGPVTVAVIGSSHSVNWLPAIDILGQKNGWKILSITKSACGFGRSSSDSCNEWHDNVITYLKKHPVDLVFIGENAGESTTNSEVELIASRWQRFGDLDLPILAIRPIPHLNKRPGDCLPDRVKDCVISRQVAERANTIALAAQRVPKVHIVDMTNAICSKDTCGPVVGNLVVYRDTHHLTATYAAALAPYLEQSLRRVHPDLLPVNNKNADYSVVHRMSASNATLHCGPSKTKAASFSRQYSATLDGSRIIMRRGAWQNREKIFEVWDGHVDANVVTITGNYMEGTGGIKNVQLVGTMQGETIVAAGRRGPRTCSLTIVTDRRPLAR